MNCRTKYDMGEIFDLPISDLPHVLKRYISSFQKIMLLVIYCML